MYIPHPTPVISVGFLAILFSLCTASFYLCRVCLSVFAARMSHRNSDIFGISKAVGQLNTKSICIHMKRQPKTQWNIIKADESWKMNNDNTPSLSYNNGQISQKIRITAHTPRKRQKLKVINTIDFCLFTYSIRLLWLWRMFFCFNGVRCSFLRIRLVGSFALSPPPSLSCLLSLFLSRLVLTCIPFRLFRQSDVYICGLF